jgi:hypothetical protein
MSAVGVGINPSLAFAVQQRLALNGLVSYSALLLERGYAPDDVWGHYD